MSNSAETVNFEACTGLILLEPAGGGVTWNVLNFIFLILLMFSYGNIELESIYSVISVLTRKKNANFVFSSEKPANVFYWETIS